MAENEISLLMAVVDTLSVITVTGYADMARVVGCINTLNDIIRNNTKEATDGR